jgi:hypothetical protein
MSDLEETPQPHRQRARLSRRCALAGSRHSQRIGRELKKYVRGSTSPEEPADAPSRLHRHEQARPSAVAIAEDLVKRKDGRHY